MTGRPVATVYETPPRAWKDQWDDELAWTGRSAPEGDGPQAIHAAIVRRGLHRFGEVAAHVATELFARDSAHAGFIAGTGFFRSWYLIVACREIDRLRGTAITVAPRRDGGPPRPRVR